MYLCYLHCGVVIAYSSRKIIALLTLPAIMYSIGEVMLFYLAFLAFIWINCVFH